MDISPIRVVREPNAALESRNCDGAPETDVTSCSSVARAVSNVNIGSGANTPGRAGRPIEHPGRNLQPSPGCLTREAATENLSASLLNHLMNMDQASGPRMPRIKKLILRDPVGVPSSCFTIASERIDS